MNIKIEFKYCPLCGEEYINENIMITIMTPLEEIGLNGVKYIVNPIVISNILFL